MSGSWNTLGMAFNGPRSPYWQTPPKLYAALDAEFGFIPFDPCPKDPEFDGLLIDWPIGAIYMNPPYGRVIALWLRRAVEEARRGSTVVCLVPSYTGSPWWHEIVTPHASEIRFLRGKITFVGAKHTAPFWSAVVVFKKA